MAVDIKNLSEISEKIRNVSHILTETLGTTTSYTFLEDTLRPYVKKNLKEYVLNHWSDDELVEIVKALKKQAESEMKEGWVGAISIPEGEDGDEIKEAVISYALSQMDGNSMDSLNRLIVKDGYTKGHLKGHVFPDVFPAFKKWTEEGKKIYMYSSGMEMSHQCLMSNSVDGDITKIISGCFESSEFPRTKCESFRELCKKVGSPADQVAFLTHNAATASAAHKAGMVVIMLSREGNAYIGNCTRESFPVITSFEDISKQICGKRKKAPDAVESTEGKRAKLDDTASEKEAISEKKAEAGKPEGEDVKGSSDAKPLEGVDAGGAKAEVKADSEEVEGMEVDEVSEGKDEKEEKAEGREDVKIVVTPPVDEVHKSEKVSDKVNGGSEEVKETVETAKVNEDDKKEEKEEKSEVSVEKVDSDEKGEEKSKESKEEDSVSKESEDKKVVEDEKTEEVEAKGKDTKDSGDSKAKADEGVKDGGEKVDGAPCAEEEKSKENGVSEAVTVENGDAVDGAEGSEKKEVNSNGVACVNGAGDGKSGEKVTEPAEKETEKIVAKKVEKDEDKVEPTTEAVTESA